MVNKKVIVTTSWDDGNELDIRIAELLEKYNLKGTFYVPIHNKEHSVMNAVMLSEIATNFEIGGHTVNHLYLNTVGEAVAIYEISECKAILEHQLGKTIDAFCYPGGKYSLRDINLVKQAGFLFGRTTRLMRTVPEVKSLLLDTSVQVYNHTNTELTAHCLKNTFLLPIVQNCFFIKGNKNFSRLAETFMNRILTTGGVFHLWGHSWEIEEFGLWEEFELILKAIAFNQKISYLNNTECWKEFTTEKIT